MPYVPVPETLLNLMLASGSSEYTETMLTSLTMKAGADDGMDWVEYIAGSNDDAGVSPEVSNRFEEALTRLRGVVDHPSADQDV